MDSTQQLFVGGIIAWWSVRWAANQMEVRAHLCQMNEVFKNDLTTLPILQNTLPMMTYHEYAPISPLLNNIEDAQPHSKM